MPIGTRPFEFNRLETQGFSNSSTACISNTEWADGTGEIYYYLTNTATPTITDIAEGEYFYTTDNDGDDAGDLFNGQSEWYGVRTSADTASVAAVQISPTGEVLDVVTNCNYGAILSVSGAVPYVDYYIGQAVYMYKTGSQDWNSIEGAVSYSLTTITSSFSASHFNDFISASVSEYFDQTITGTITDASNQISSSLQFQGYPTFGQSYIAPTSESGWTDLGQDTYLIIYDWDTSDGGDDLDTLTGFAPGTTGTSYDGTHAANNSIQYVGYGTRNYVGPSDWSDGASSAANYYIAYAGDDTTAGGAEHIIVNQDKILSDFPLVTSFEIELFTWWYGGKGDGALPITVQLWNGGTWTKNTSTKRFTNAGGTKVKEMSFELACTRGNTPGRSIQSGDRTYNHQTNQDAYLKMGKLIFESDSTGNLTVSLTNSTSEL